MVTRRSSAHTAPSTGPAPGAASASEGAGSAPTVESIAQDLAAAIVERRIAPGTWLREEALGRVYAVSRTKVRAALVMLAKDKLVHTVPDKGTFVCQPTVEEAREIFSARRALVCGPCNAGRL